MSVKQSGSPVKGMSTALKILLGIIAFLCMVPSLLVVIARALPVNLQALPFVPVVISVTPWFSLVAIIALILALTSQRWLIALIALCCVGVQIYWQSALFIPSSTLSKQAVEAVSVANANLDDSYARVMSANVFKGRADAQQIVDAVKNERIEVLALQETSDAFVQELNNAGIQDYLPYSIVSSSDGKYGNGLWSATKISQPKDDEVHSSASFMPGGSITIGGKSIRFVSVHTTAPVNGYWDLWKRSLDEIDSLQSNHTEQYVLMGDFNATIDHASFRDMLGSRFQDATKSAGEGFNFTWPANRRGVPALVQIDHIVIDQHIVAGQMKVLPISGSDHKALIATLEFK